MESKRTILPITLLGIFVLLLMSPVLGGRTWYIRDITYLFHPWRTLAAEMLQKGEFPLWDPYAFCGMPFFANWQSAVLYPFSILFSFFSFPFALKLFDLSHLMLAGIFAYLFGRQSGLSRWAAAGVMIVFALNGFVVTRMEFLSYFGVIAWTFAFLLAAGQPLLLAMITFIAFLSGHQAFFFVVVCLILYALFRSIRARSLHPCRTVVLGGIFAAFLSAVQLLPTLELTRVSERAQRGLESSVAFLYSFQLADLLQLISPYVAPRMWQTVGGERFAWPVTCFCGFTVILLIIYGQIKEKLRPMNLFAASLIVFGAFLALGDSTPLYPWLYRHLTLFHLFRYPAQYLFFVIVGISILFGKSLSVFRGRAFVVLLAAGELTLTAYGFQSTAAGRFFSFVPGPARFLQQHLDNGRFILSPGTEKNRVMRGGSNDEGWQNARASLYNLTCLPYHLQNAYGSGEPLTAGSVERLVDAAYRQPTPESALPYYRDLGVRFLISRSPIPADSFRLSYRDPSIYIYELQPPGSLNDATNVSSVSQVVNRPGYVRLTTHAAVPNGTVQWKELNYPGWEVYVNGKRTSLNVAETFRAWHVPAGDAISVHIYRPPAFRFGLLLTLLSLLGLALYGVRRTSGLRL